LAPIHSTRASGSSGAPKRCAHALAGLWREVDELARLFPYWRRGAQDDTIEREEERFPLQDRLEWIDGERFLPNGRIDQAVQVGGTNVHPAYVAKVLALHPGVRECVVRPMRPEEGTRLKSLVVPGADFVPALLRAELVGWIAERLTPPERQAAFSFGPALLPGPGGKPPAMSSGQICRRRNLALIRRGRARGRRGSR
jgi:acyl-coenzyme A synthetase/AMP-(fatty) acid ligase